MTGVMFNGLDSVNIFAPSGARLAVSLLGIQNEESWTNVQPQRDVRLV